MTKPISHRSGQLNVLYVAHSLPYPPSKGEKIRTFHQIRELAREHRVHLVCGIEENDDDASVQALARICASVQAIPIGRFASRLRAARSLIIGKPRSAHSHIPPALRQTVERMLRSEGLDVILASTIAMAACVRHIDTIPKALDLMDVTSQLWEATASHQPFPWSWLHRLEARRLARYETEVARCFDCVIVVSETEAQLFSLRAADVPVAVVGNGVDFNVFVPHTEASHRPPVVVFTGSMDYFPNVDAVRYFCKSILPGVRKAVGDVRFTIVGRRPTRAIRKLGRNVQVTVTGFVPDVRPYLDGASVSVAPFRISRGIKNKILESMASGVPVVGTSLVLDPLNVTDADGARRADDPESFTREIVALLRDHQWQAICSRRARRFAERCHRWDLHSPCRLLETMVMNCNRRDAEVDPITVPKAPPVTVVVPTRDRGSQVAKTLSSLLEVDYPTFEVRVVDQSVDDATEEAVRRFGDDPRVHYERSASQGISAAINRGIGGATSDLVAITGDDCDPATDWLRNIVASFVLDREIGIVFGNVLSAPHDEATGFVPGYVRSSALRARGIRDMHLLGGTSACMALRRIVWQELCGFDEMFGVGGPLRAGEDLDFTIRALNRGYHVYETPTVKVVHRGFYRRNDRAMIIKRNWYGTGAAFAKSLRRGHPSILLSLARLACRWTTAGPSPVAASFGRGPLRWSILGAFLHGFLAGALTGVDRTSGHYKPRAVSLTSNQS